VDDILEVGPNKARIQELKVWLAKELDKKDLGPTNKILGMQINQDIKDKIFWLSHKKYLLKILQCFNMQDCKSIYTPSYQLLLMYES